MLYLLTSHTTGRLAFPLKHFLRAALPDGRYRLVNAVPKDLAPTDVIVGFTNPASNGLRKLKLSGDEIREASKFNLRHKLKAPGPMENDKNTGTSGIKGTFWRATKLPNSPMCCCTWHPKAGLYVYRTLTARWLQIASIMSKKATVAEQDAMLHKWNATIEPPDIAARLRKSTKIIACDTENNWNGERATKLTMISIADEFGSAVWRWTPEVERIVGEWLATLGSRPIVFQNGPHDIPWLENSCKVKMQGCIYDTMALAAEFCRQWPKGLQHITAQFHIVEPWKSMHKEGALAEIEYAAYDAEATHMDAVELFRLMPSLEGSVTQIGWWPEGLAKCRL